MKAIKITIKMDCNAITNDYAVQSGESRTLPMAIKSILILTDRIFSCEDSEIDF